MTTRIRPAVTTTMANRTMAKTTMGETMRKTARKPGATTHRGGLGWLGQGRGSALILTVLLTLILSAMAIVAMRDVARSVHQSGVFRTRLQADLMSESALQVYAKRSGDKANSVLSALRKGTAGMSDDGTTGIYGQDMRNVGSGAATLKDQRIAQATEGGHVEISSTTKGVREDFMTGTTGSESGLFLKPGDTTGAIHSFETQRDSEWRVIIRDPTDGIPAPGFSNRYCFKKVLIASDATVGVNDGDWNTVNNIANRRHAFDALLGPVECGYQ